jgi:hypothetical protein
MTSLAALSSNSSCFPLLPQSSTGTVRIDMQQNRMSLSPWMPLEEILAPMPQVVNYPSMINISSRTVASFLPVPAALSFVAKTPLGKKLAEIRQRAIASGLRLLTEEEISAEIEQRRGENRE